MRILVLLLLLQDSPNVLQENKRHTRDREGDRYLVSSRMGHDGVQGLFRLLRERGLNGLIRVLLNP